MPDNGLARTSRNINSNKLAAITFDMDDLDVLRDGYGVDVPFPLAVYDRAVPRMLEFLDRQQVRATFFVIADHARKPEVQRRLRDIVANGHEIGNHSLKHQHLLHMDRQEILRDVTESTAILEDAVGEKPLGFRGPSLTLNDHLHDILLSCGYAYDSTVNPTYFFIFEWIYLSICNPSSRNLPEFFYLKHATAPNRPYRVSAESFFRSAKDGALIELPIANACYLKVPFYPTFHFLFPFSYPLFRPLFLRNAAPVILSHGLDFLSLEDDGLPERFGKHPGMCIPWAKKQAYFNRLVSDLKGTYHSLTPARELAAAFAAKDR